MNIQNLLQRVVDINKKYEQFEKISGENFNIFSIFGLASMENIHSQFIAELLNPNGSHGQKYLYLKLFLEELDLVSNYEQIKVITEYSIGGITEDYKQGGRVDIFIKSMPKNIIIENKIYAGDQYNQLYRYYQSDTNANLLYLTLFGTKPSDESLNGLSKDSIICISYQDHILSWLGKCIEKSASLPIIRETIIQYCNVIKKLTNQCSNRDREIEIIDALMSSEVNFEAAQKIKVEYDRINKLPDNIFFTKITDALNKRFGKGELTNILQLVNNYTIQINMTYHEGLKLGIAPLKNNKMAHNGDFKWQDEPLLNKVNNIIQKYISGKSYNIDGYWENMQNYFCLIPVQNIEPPHESYLFNKDNMTFNDYKMLSNQETQQKIINCAVELCVDLKLFIEKIHVDKL